MVNLVWLWFLLLAPTIGEKVVPDLTSPGETQGTWKASVILPCVYEPSPDFLEQSVVWRQVDHHGRAIFRRDIDSGDQTRVALYRDRLTVPKQPLGDVSLRIDNLDMADRGQYTCEVTWLTKNNTRITVSKTMTLKVKKVPVTKPVIKVTNNDETSLPGIMRINLTCLTSGSPPITYRWYKEGQGSNVTLVGKEAILPFDQLEVLDAGRYYCEVENRLSAHRQRSKALRINVESRPVSSTLGPATKLAMNTTAGADTTSMNWMMFEGGTTSSSFNSRELTTANRPATTAPLTTVTGQPSGIPGSKIPEIAIILLVLITLFATGVITAIICYRRRMNDDDFPISYCHRARNNERKTSEDSTASNGLHPAIPEGGNRCACSYQYEALNGGADNSYILAPILGLEEEAIELKTVNTYETLVNDMDSESEVVDAL